MFCTLPAYWGRLDGITAFWRMPGWDYPWYANAWFRIQTVFSQAILYKENSVSDQTLSFSSNKTLFLTLDIVNCNCSLTCRTTSKLLFTASSIKTKFSQTHVHFLIFLWNVKNYIQKISVVHQHTIHTKTCIYVIHVKSGFASKSSLLLQYHVSKKACFLFQAKCNNNIGYDFSSVMS